MLDPHQSKLALCKDLNDDLYVGDLLFYLTVDVEATLCCTAPLLFDYILW